LCLSHHQERKGDAAPDASTNAQDRLGRTTPEFGSSDIESGHRVENEPTTQALVSTTSALAATVTTPTSIEPAPIVTGKQAPVILSDSDTWLISIVSTTTKTNAEEHDREVIAIDADQPMHNDSPPVMQHATIVHPPVVDDGDTPLDLIVTVHLRDGHQESQQYRVLSRRS
jgi:hypothetical protein